MNQRLFQPPRAQGPFAQVVPERGIDDPRGLTYAIPDAMADLATGERVEVPLGRGGQTVGGVVVALALESDLDPAKIKPVKRRTGVSLPPSLLELARWVASYYCCPLGMVLASMLPAAVKHGTGGYTREELVRTGRAPEGRLPPATARAWEGVAALPDEAFPIEPKDLAEAAGASNLGPINRLVDAGLLERVRRARIRAGPFDVAPDARPKPELTEAQARAVDAIGSTADRFAVHLLHGVTGSGKTEVYLRALERVLSAGKSGLVLVPEIGLTPQAVSRFLGRFGDHGVAVLHSGLTAAQRHAQWARVRTGEARVAIGARSAVFAPFEHAGEAALGLIVVDEEHDGAYKQEDQQPRHHARDVAIRRAQIAGCPVVLGSATPSMESWRHAREGKYRLRSLGERVGGARMPRVEIVDLREEIRRDESPSARESLVGPRLRAELRRTLDAGAQAILLLNRRGWANTVACPDRVCGWSLRCDACDANLVVHRSRDLPVGGVVRCHHCLAEKRVPKVCPVCGRKAVMFGTGSQRAERDLQRWFPDLVEGETMLRLDGDTMRRAADWFDALARFETGEVRVLLGTQMIGKGLDFPRVRLVGVLSADTGLHLPDFRAAERTYQLVSQVAGRAGRGREPGLVLVQTLCPEERAIRLAARHDYETFADEELRTRGRAHLPPLTRMARVIVRDEDEKRAWDDAKAIADALRDGAGPGLDVVGPLPCVIARVQDRYRVAVEVTGPSAAPVQGALARLRSLGLAKNDRRTAVDVDPISLL